MKVRVRSSPLYCAVLLMLLLLAALSLLWPRQEVSEIENRTLERIPALSWDSIRRGSYPDQTEKAMGDQFPFRNSWLGVNALFEMALLKAERQGILIGKNGRLFFAPQSTAKTFFDNARAIRKLKSASGLDPWLMLVPTAEAVYPEDLPAFYQPWDQENLIREAYLFSGANTIDLLPALHQKKDQILYYKSDHHWTAQGARVGYEVLADTWGFSPVPAANQLRVPGFFGSLASRLASPFVKADELSFDLYEAPQLYSADIKRESLYDAAQLKRRDKYAALLWDSPTGILTLTNPQPKGSGGATLLVLRDSYADALLPAVAMHFHKVIALDLRYWQGDLLALCQKEGVERILCIYGVSTWLTDRSLPAAFSDWAP